MPATRGPSPTQERLKLAIESSKAGVWDLAFNPGSERPAAHGAYLSPRFKALLGYTDGETAGCLETWKQRVKATDLARLLHRAEEHRLGRSATFDVECRMRHKDGSWRWIQLRGALVRDTRGRAQRWSGIAWDVTDRPEAWKRFRSHFELLPQPAYLWQRRGDDFVLIDSNAAALEVTGERVTELHGKGAREMFADMTEIPVELELCHRRGSSVHREAVYTFRSTGETRELDITYVPVPPDLVVVHTEDITERKEAARSIKLYQRKLQALASELSLTGERERRGIAADLHSHIIQPLGVAKIKLGELLQALSNEDTRSLTKEVRSLVEGLIRETRSVLFDLSPPVLYELGLEAALEWLVERRREEHGLECHLVGELRVEPDEALKVLLFQSAREFLANATQHGAAQRIVVHLRADEEQVELSVEDDGNGFRPEIVDALPSSTGGFGLFSIREQVSHLGGELVVESAPGEGAKMTLQIPFREQSRA